MRFRESSPTKAWSRIRGSVAPGRLGRGPRRHARDGVGSALCRCPPQVREREVLAEPAPHLGEVVLEQLPLEALELPSEDLTVHRVEQGVDDDHAVDRAAAVDAAAMASGFGLVLGVVGGGVDAPVADHPFELGVPKLLRPLDEPGFVVGVLVGVGVLGVGQAARVVGGDVPRQHRPFGRRHLPKVAGRADRGGRSTLVDVGLPRQPGGRGLGPVHRPDLRAVEHARRARTVGVGERPEALRVDRVVGDLVAGEPVGGQLRQLREQVGDLLLHHADRPAPSHGPTRRRGCDSPEWPTHSPSSRIPRRQRCPTELGAVRGLGCRR
jgi:hypothetical protein